MSAHDTASCWSMLDAVRLRRVSRLLPALAVALVALSPSAFSAKDGMLDLSFAPSFGENVSSVKGKVVVSGDSYYVSASDSGDQPGGIWRLRRDGTIDNTFQCPLRGQLLKMLPLPSGGLIVWDVELEGAEGSNVPVYRVDASGAIDPTFHRSTFTPSSRFGPSPLIWDASVDSIGRIYLSGFFDTFENQPRTVLVRLLSDGTIDTAFNPPQHIQNWWLPYLALTPDEKVLVGAHLEPGEVTTADVLGGSILRLNQDGSLDPGFNCPLSAPLSPIRVAHDGRFAVVSQYSSLSVHLPDGAFDESFTPWSYGGPPDPRSGDVTQAIVGPDWSALDLAWDDGKVILLGYWELGRPLSSPFGVLRLNADGTQDASWSRSSVCDGWGQIGGITRDRDGSWLVSGTFTSFAGVPRAGVARLKPAEATELTWFNTSARGRVTAADPLIVGFVVGGSAPQGLLVRGVGQSLARFGITNGLAQPVLRVHRGETLLLERKGMAWTYTPANNMNVLAAEVGAFALDDTVDGDAADTIVLPPGAYTLVISSGDGTEGTALGEVYSLDAQ